MFASLRYAFGFLFQPAFRGLLVRSALFTLLLLLVTLAAAEYLVSLLPVLGNPLVNKALALLAPILFIFLLGAIGAPVAAVIGTLFLDRLAGRIEARDFPQSIVRPGAFWSTLTAGLRLSAAVLGADILLLPLDIGLPGIGEAASLLVNGWLLGWEYFELAALRHLTPAAADALRKSQGWRVWGSGMAISILSAVPVLDLIAPLFGTALMVHLFHRIQTEDPE
jgi:CysZ protein